eukprot:CAMPEP_0115205882 /NCGR_PEP_ID=MMETSP0270-20121206/19913_1 /TAXON_ID=71861 /ORGANISM="Scrippsiella trochoidea, Strain CCMP3099" /LENGTH=221 /DNA_ID=CAMNT_0002619425 /DNA_START=38 /DNA_END=699 /DNA_ORIENTATION=+
MALLMAPHNNQHSASPWLGAVPMTSASGMGSAPLQQQPQQPAALPQLAPAQCLQQQQLLQQHHMMHLQQQQRLLMLQQQQQQQQQQQLVMLPHPSSVPQLVPLQAQQQQQQQQQQPGAALKSFNPPAAMALMAPHNLHHSASPWLGAVLMTSAPAMGSAPLQQHQQAMVLPQLATAQCLQQQQQQQQLLQQHHIMHLQQQLLLIQQQQQQQQQQQPLAMLP